MRKEEGSWIMGLDSIGPMMAREKEEGGGGLHFWIDKGNERWNLKDILGGDNSVSQQIDSTIQEHSRSLMPAGLLPLNHSDLSSYSDDFFARKSRGLVPTFSVLLFFFFFPGYYTKFLICLL